MENNEVAIKALIRYIINSGGPSSPPPSMIDLWITLRRRSQMLLED
jgi:hypothetical protein